MYASRVLVDSSGQFKNFQLARADGHYFVFQAVKDDNQFVMSRADIRTGTLTTIVNTMLANAGTLPLLGENPSVNEMSVVTFKAVRKNGVRHTTTTC